MGHFSEEALQKFNAMCSNSADFAEGGTYDFARCVKPNGEVYGTKGQCKSGKPTSSNEMEKKGGSIKDLSKVIKAYKDRIGENMTASQVTAAANKIGVKIPAGQSAEDFLKTLIPSGDKVMPVKSA